MAKSRVLECARAAVDEIGLLTRRSRPNLPNEDQLRRAADSIVLNLRESSSRHTTAGRNQFLGFAIGSAEETDECLRINFAAKRIPASTYWRLHNRLTLVCRMLRRIMG